MPNSVVHFEIPADDVARARTFYEKTFGWTIKPFPMPPGKEYFGVTTRKKGEPGIDGGLMKRMHPGHTITNYILVPSVSQAAAKVKKLGGEICRPKTAVPTMGYFVICKDTEENTFALWEVNDRAK